MPPQACLRAAEREHKELRCRHTSVFPFSQEVCLWPKWLQEHYTGNMAAFVKSDPLPIPWARHDLMKFCLPLAGAAVFKIYLKTHPRWPQADHFLYVSNTA